MGANRARPEQDWDQLSKAGVRLGLSRLLRIVGEDIGDEDLRPLTVELPGTPLRADLVHETRGGRIVHVEIQHRSDPLMPVRMLAYLARLFQLHPQTTLPGGLVQIVVQVTGRAMPEALVTDVLDYRFHLVHVPSTDPDVLLDDPGLAPFAAGRSDPGLAPRIADALQRIADDEIRIKLFTLAVDLDPGDTPMTEILRRRGMTDVYERVAEKLRDTPAPQRWIAESREEGREEGREEAVLEVLAVRFPTVDPGRLATLAHDLVRDHGRRAAGAALTVDEPAAS